MSEKRCIGAGLVVEPTSENSWDVYGAGRVGVLFGHVRRSYCYSISLCTFHPSYSVRFYDHQQMAAIAKFLRELEVNLPEKST
jgi:hypothetical protein